MIFYTAAAACDGGQSTMTQMTEMTDDQSGAFDGVKVLELAQWVFVPVCGAVLADWGADVIRIEHPFEGDPYRGLVSQGILTSHNGINMSLELANRGKRGLALDIRTPAGRDVVYKLIE